MIIFYLINDLYQYMYMSARVQSKVCMNKYSVK